MKKNEVTTEFLAYSAGFFDADGSVGVYFTKDTSCVRGGYYKLDVQIAQMFWMPIFLEWQQQWGGAVHRGQKNSWVWHIGSMPAASFLRSVLPYLRKKQEQARLAIKFQELSKHHGPSRPLTREEFTMQKAIGDALKEMKRSAETRPPKHLLARAEECFRQLRLGLWE